MRSIQTEIESFLDKDHKMVFIAGPRQVGKTTFAQNLLKEKKSLHAYFNWDIETHRKKILSDPVHFWQTIPQKPSFIVLDEIHKYPRWKRFLKGFFDANKDQVEILVTGSGRLDVYQKGGDSLFGRYHLFHLMPFSVGELLSQHDFLEPEKALQGIFTFSSSAQAQEKLDLLWDFSGFPEPFFSGSRKKLTQWQNDHRQLILKEDLRDLTRVREIGLIEALIYLLPERIGSPLSINALREDLSVNFKTVQNWLQILERLYYLFGLSPYAGRLNRTLKQEKKFYFFDWSELEDDGKRLENFVAIHLLKAVLYWTDAGYGSFTLHYIRDKEKRETDFLICQKNKPFLLVETKLSETKLNPSLRYFSERIKPSHGAFQIVKNVPPDWLIKQTDSITCTSVSRFLANLP